MRYHHCVSNRAWQDQALQRITTLLGVSSLVGVAFLAKQNLEKTEGFIETLYRNSLEKIFNF